MWKYYAIVKRIERSNKQSNRERMNEWMAFGVWEKTQQQQKAEKSWDIEIEIEIDDDVKRRQQQRWDGQKVSITKRGEDGGLWT